MLRSMSSALSFSFVGLFVLCGCTTVMAVNPHPTVGIPVEMGKIALDLQNVPDEQKPFMSTVLEFRKTLEAGFRNMVGSKFSQDQKAAELVLHIEQARVVVGQDDYGRDGQVKFFYIQYQATWTDGMGNRIAQVAGDASPRNRSWRPDSAQESLKKAVAVMYEKMVHGLEKAQGISSRSQDALLAAGSGSGSHTGRFAVSADGFTVTDTRTGLVWQRDGSGKRMGCSGKGCTWAESKAYCAGLTLGGLSGWRLPAVDELLTIVDYTRDEPTIDLAAFQNTPSDWFWTSSLIAGSSGNARSVNFNNGVSYSLVVGNGCSVLCVSGSTVATGGTTGSNRVVGIDGATGTGGVGGTGTIAGHYAVSADGLTVTDGRTGLVWQRDGSSKRIGCRGKGGLTCAPDEAKAYCAGLTLAGFSGWRLPAVDELLTTVDYTRANPAIDPTAFPNTPSTWFWTSSPYAGTFGSAWLIGFDFGYSGYGGAGDFNRVRCVR